MENNFISIYRQITEKEVVDFDMPDLVDVQEGEEILPACTDNQIDYLYTILRETTFDADQSYCLESQIEECKTIREFEEVEHYLQLNRIQPHMRICMGLNVNATDIKRTVNYKLRT